jgi:hypothetical protein
MSGEWGQNSGIRIRQQINTTNDFRQKQWNTDPIHYQNICKTTPNLQERKPDMPLLQSENVNIKQEFRYDDVSMPTTTPSEKQNIPYNSILTQKTCCIFPIWF